MLVLLAVMKVEGARNMKTAAGLPPASSVRAPDVIVNVPTVGAYTPGGKGCPPKSAVTVAVAAGKSLNTAVKMA